MHFYLHIDLSNDAFKPEPMSEVYQILLNLADKLIQAKTPMLGRVLDTNGNVVGSYGRTTPTKKGRKLIIPVD